MPPSPAKVAALALAAADPVPLPGPSGGFYYPPSKASPATIARTLEGVLETPAHQRELDSPEGLRVPPPRGSFGSGEWNTTVHALVSLVHHSGVSTLGPFRVQTERDGGLRIRRAVQGGHGERTSYAGGAMPGIKRGDVVEVTGEGKTSTWGRYVGIVARVAGGSVFVKWLGSFVEDEMAPGEVRRLDEPLLARDMRAFANADDDERREIAGRVAEHCRRLGLPEAARRFAEIAQTGRYRLR